MPIYTLIRDDFVPSDKYATTHITIEDALPIAAAFSLAFAQKGDCDIRGSTGRQTSLRRRESLNFFIPDSKQDSKVTKL